MVCEKVNAYCCICWGGGGAGNNVVLTKIPNLPNVTIAVPICSTRFRARNDTSFSRLSSSCAE
jgi:hypothetical protein